MYCYNSLLLIINILILTVQTLSQKQKGPGISGCAFAGSTNEGCGLPVVQVKDIPTECTSISFFRTIVDLSYNIFADPCMCVTNNQMLGHLDEILKAGKPTYLYYGHIDQTEWTQVLASEDSNGGVNSSNEMKSLKAFLDKHPNITGIILLGLDNDPNSSIEFPNYSVKFKKYLEVMKKSFPNLEIGIELQGSLLIDQIFNPQIPWLNINVIDPDIDFYIISLICLNDCKAELINTGIAPKSSSSTNYTMEKIETALPKANITISKTYFAYRLGPNSDPNDTNTRCNLTIQEICTNKNGTSTWCSDSQTSFQEKGQFAKKNGIGFVTTNIDFNDPKNECKCEKPFGSFYALLDGFNGVKSKPCTLFTRV